MTMNQENHELVTIYETWDKGIVALAKSLLDEAGIRYYVRNEMIQDFFAEGSLGANVLLGPMEIQVQPDDAEAATELLKDLYESKPTTALSHRVRWLIVLFVLILPILLWILESVWERR